MPTAILEQTRPYRAYTRKDIDRIPELHHLDPHEIVAMKAVSAVLPFRVNEYVVTELIRWQDVPDDPIYQLTFPQRGMLDRTDFRHMADLVRSGAPEEIVRAEAETIQRRLNPHPAGQLELNVPRLDGMPIPGMQHKYRETVLFFPSQGQTCHAYCTYCFRWAQFVGLDDLRFANGEAESLVGYLRQHPEVTDVLITGGDPLIMKTRALRNYIEPLLAPDLEHVTTIRLGTKAPAYWPFRFLGGGDAEDLLRLFDEVRQRGRHIALMAHYSHPRELMTPASQKAVERIHSAGAVIRCQAPLIRHVNDSSHTWADLWRLQVQLGAVPYYMFVERDTGPKNYFEVPLARAVDIYRRAIRRVGGLGRTVRGAIDVGHAGKVIVHGVTKIGDEKVFVLGFVQARDPRWVQRPFFARYDENATWLDELEPALGARHFFFTEALDEIRRTGRARAWGETRDFEGEGQSLFGHVEWE